MINIDVDELLYRKITISELESNLNGNDETEAYGVTKVIQEAASVSTKINKIRNIASTNQYEYHLE